MDEADLYDLIWLVLSARYGLCPSCHFAPVREQGAVPEPWRCPRCGCLYSDDPELHSPMSRVFDPTGEEEPRYEDAPSIPEDDEDDELEPDLLPALTERAWTPARPRGRRRTGGHSDPRTGRVPPSGGTPRNGRRRRAW